MAPGDVGGIWLQALATAIATVLSTFFLVRCFFMKRRRDNLLTARAPSRSAPRETDANSHLSSGPEPDHGRSDEPSSSSSIPVQPGHEYDVFLSFREPDTRSGFTDFLYHSLQDVGVRTFRGDGVVRVGEELGPEILGAIEQSRVSVPSSLKDMLPASGA